ncbi:hypothetical protein Curi_c22120 [Gottschalkia acidurici 9a]|uniref:Uncharacterized protein n=1 Tax=Gottschalkia acidurici (strain ATCC 7906 / DSM 604 / BCRC 14475 / CIP 104303 / KCTC 5404 / NCIMB 10678 / 9a) TaxID=1128398 RepID=K0B2P6_GOTA9|nr:hypothetical protein [Gottschalkia acidurici]AFS79215.1 hypothetical protein Curi_c22120 [Gottschalkia acidurici 9a]
MKKYDATYKLGNTTVHIVAPPPLTEDDWNKIKKGLNRLGLEIWREDSGEDEEGEEV